MHPTAKIIGALKREGSPKDKGEKGFPVFWGLWGGGGGGVVCCCGGGGLFCWWGGVLGSPVQNPVPLERKGETQEKIAI